MKAIHENTLIPVDAQTLEGEENPTIIPLQHFVAVEEGETPTVDEVVAFAQRKEVSAVCIDKHGNYNYVVKLPGEDTFSPRSYRELEKALQSLAS